MNSALFIQLKCHSFNYVWLTVEKIFFLVTCEKSQDVIWFVKIKTEKFGFTCIYKYSYIIQTLDMIPPKYLIYSIMDMTFWDGLDFFLPSVLISSTVVQGITKNIPLGDLISTTFSLLWSFLYQFHASLSYIRVGKLSPLWTAGLATIENFVLGTLYCT